MYGGIPVKPPLLIESVSFLLFFILLLNLFSKEKFSLIKIPIFPLVLLLFLVTLQLLPLSGKLISFLSPTTASLYREFTEGSLNKLGLSICPDATLGMLLQFLSYAAVFIVVINYIDTRKKQRRLILMLIFLGFIISILGIVHKLSVSFRQFSTFANRNLFAAHIEMIIPLGITYSLTKLSKIERILIIFMVTVMALALFLSFSRAGMASFSLSLFFLVPLLKTKKMVKRRMGIILTLFLFLVFFLSIVGISQIWERIRTLSFSDYSVQYRINEVKTTPKIIKDFPIFGTGLGTIQYIFDKYSKFLFLTTDIKVKHFLIHNEPIQLLIEVGCLGVLLLAIFLILYFKNIFSLWRKRNDPYVVCLTLGCLTGIFSISIHSLFDFVFHSPANALLFFIFLGLVCRIAYLKEPQDLLPIPKFEILLSKYFKIFFIVLSCIFLFYIEQLIFNRFKAEEIFLKIREKKISQTGVDAILEYKKVLKDIDKAIILNPMNSLYFDKKADILTEIALREDLKDVLSILDQFEEPASLKIQAEELYKKAINLNPTQAEYHLRLGWLYLILEKKDLAQNEFEKALLLDPENNEIKTYIKQSLAVGAV